jgi:hypothetical protein
MLRKALCLLVSATAALAASGTQEFDVLLEDMVEKVSYQIEACVRLADVVIDSTTTDSFSGSALCR